MQRKRHTEVMKKQRRFRKAAIGSTGFSRQSSWKPLEKGGDAYGTLPSYAGSF